MANNDKWWKWKKLYNSEVMARKAAQQTLVDANIPAWEARLAKADAEASKLTEQRNKANGRAKAAQRKIIAHEATIAEQQTEINELHARISEKDAIMQETLAELGLLKELRVSDVVKLREAESVKAELDKAKSTIGRMTDTIHTAGRIINVIESDSKAIARDLSNLRRGVMTSQQKNDLANKVYDRMSRVFARANGIFATMKGLSPKVVSEIRETIRWCEEKAESHDQDEAAENAVALAAEG